MKKMLVTCALPYANGPIHIGHLVEYIQADIWVRFQKMLGKEARFFCADDTHGTPIMIAARTGGVEPEEIIARWSREHQEDFAGFQIQFDNYYSTHSEENLQLVNEIYRRAREGGHVFEKEVEQAYCENEEIFLPDRYLRGTCPNCGAADQYGDVCEVCARTYSVRELIDARCAQCGSKASFRKSSHLFFRLADFEEKLQDWVSSGHLQKEVSNKLQEWFGTGLKDWDISRDAPYFGFEIPDHPGQYFYVWVDAPVGYMAATLNWCTSNGADFDDYWRSQESEVYHFIGKDIIYFHSLFWPALLMASGFRTPTAIYVHGFLTVNGAKMSKSRGTFITAREYLKHLDPQYLRYYYACKLSAGIDDIDLSHEDFLNRVNSELVGKIANIPSRSLAILHKHCSGRLGRLDSEGKSLLQSVSASSKRIADFYNAREYARAIRLINEMADRINGYFQSREPWLAENRTSGSTLVTCTAALNAFKVVATYLKPILPEFAASTAGFLGLSELSWEQIANPFEECPVQPYTRLVNRLSPQELDKLREQKTD